MPIDVNYRIINSPNGEAKPATGMQQPIVIALIPGQTANNLTPVSTEPNHKNFNEFFNHGGLFSDVRYEENPYYYNVNYDDGDVNYGNVYSGNVESDDIYNYNVNYDDGDVNYGNVYSGNVESDDIYNYNVNYGNNIDSAKFSTTPIGEKIATLKDDIKKVLGYEVANGRLSDSEVVLVVLFNRLTRYMERNPNASPKKALMDVLAKWNSNRDGANQILRIGKSRIPPSASKAVNNVLTGKPKTNAGKKALRKKINHFAHTRNKPGYYKNCEMSETIHSPDVKKRIHVAREDKLSPRGKWFA